MLWRRSVWRGSRRIASAALPQHNNYNNSSSSNSLPQPATSLEPPSESRLCSRHGNKRMLALPPPPLQPHLPLGKRQTATRAQSNPARTKKSPMRVANKRNQTTFWAAVTIPSVALLLLWKKRREFDGRQAQVFVYKSVCAYFSSARSTAPLKAPRKPLKLCASFRTCTATNSKLANLAQLTYNNQPASRFELGAR